MKRLIKPRKLRDKSAGKGKWSKKEQINYINFLEDNYDIMKCANQRKNMKIFSKMATYIRSRVP